MSAPKGHRLEVFHHLFAAACEEMGATLQRSSFSPNIKERRDFSCALFDGDARMVGQAAHLPVHLGSTPMSVRAAIEHVDLADGDVVVLNDPYAGGTHLPDVTLVAPVFLPGRRRADFFVANRAHHADVGGATPGSMAPMPDVHGEGLRIPPVRLVRDGEIDREVLGLLLANMRVPAEREGDLFAQWSAARLGVRRVHELVAEHGAREVRAHAEGLLAWTEELVREALRAIPDGEYRFEDELEEPHAEGGRAFLRLVLYKRGPRLTCDFTGTDAVPASPLNTVRAVTVSAVFYVLRTLLPPGTPTNDGILRPVEIRTAPGTLADATYPMGVAAGNVETSQRLVDVLLGALARALGPRIPAASAGTMSNLTFGGSTAAGERFAYYETIAGGAGAGASAPGQSAVQTHMTNTLNTPIEALEANLPVRVLRYAVGRGSGGEGRSAGGDGVVKSLRFLRPVRMTWVAQRQRRGPWGLGGGRDGRPGGARVGLQGARKRAIEGHGSHDLPAGAEVELRTPWWGRLRAPPLARGNPLYASGGCARISPPAGQQAGFFLPAPS
ncbi:MAG: hydantoinase B/oxoprolinase family protein [Planctomycetota bacterium]